MLKPNMKWMGDVLVTEAPLGLLTTWHKPIFIEHQPPHEIVDGDVVKVVSEFMGWNDKGEEVWYDTEMPVPPAPI